MINRKLISFCFGFVLIAPIFTTVNIADAKVQNGNFSGGDGTLYNPYHIENVYDLQNISSNLNAHYILKNDINASNTKTWSSGSGFSPIGTQSNPFIGNLFGNNYTISSITINRSNKMYIGLFGYVGQGGSIYNLNITNCSIVGNTYVGSIIGYNYHGTISNCSVNANIIGIVDEIGGLIGYDVYGSVNNCSFNGNLKNNGNYTGGIVGQSYYTVITNSHSNGNLTGYGYAGGIVGCISTGKIVNCFSKCKIYCKGNNIGGLVGINTVTTISDCYSLDNVTGLGNTIGGLIGFNNGGIISNCYFEGNVSGVGLGGLIGSNTFGEVLNSHYNIDKVLLNNKNSLSIGGLYEDQYQDWFSNNLNLNISHYNKTLAQSGDYYCINDVSGFKNILGFSDNNDYKFKLTSDINLTNYPGLFIPYLESQEFDGGNNTITNLYVNSSSNSIGLIGYNTGGYIKNIKLTNFYVSGFSYIGGMVGYNNGDGVLNCFASGVAIGSTNIGGLIGNTERGSISDCNAFVNVKGDYNIGGLIGRNRNDVSNCIVNAIVDGNSNKIGGLIGFNTYSVFNCHSSGKVNGINGEVGGLIGDNRGRIHNCSSESFINGSMYGIGGLVGVNTYGEVENSFATGTVGGNGVNVGGLIGYQHSDSYVYNSYSTGNVTGTINIGGFIGNNSNGTLINCFSIGTVKGTGNNIGGFSGYNEGDKVSGCFWDVNKSKQTSSSVGIAKTTKEMKIKNTYILENWDFDYKWSIIEKKTYPFLKWEDKKPPKAIAGNDQIIDGGTIFHFDGTRSSDNIGIVNWTWILNDNGIIYLYGSQPTYKFSKIGVFEINLTVEDYVGYTGHDKLNITVEDYTSPIANAGIDQIIDEGNIVSFNGMGSFDNVEVENWTWTFIDVIPITLYGSNPTYLFNNPGRFYINLNVEDKVGHQHNDTVNITVLDITPPKADAGTDIVIDEDIEVIFNGSKSFDNVGVENWTWYLLDSPVVIFYGPKPTYIFKDPGYYSIKLHVTDKAGNGNYDIINITVLDVTNPVSIPGSDQEINEDTLFTFNGIGSVDNVGIINWTWIFNDKELITLYGSQYVYIFQNPGSYHVKLTVTDASGNSHTDTMNITVLDITSPIADAGTDQVINEDSSLTFNGSRSLDNVEVVNWTWTIHSEEDITVFGVSPTFLFNEPGQFTVVLNVTDAKGKWDTDTLNITVLDITSPSSDAGDDREVAIGTIVILNGSPSSDNGILSVFTWAFIYSGEEVILEGEEVQYKFNEAGTYEITLTVIDGNGNKDQDTVIITVYNTGTLTGSVIDNHGNGISGAKVTVTDPGGNEYSSTTGTNGSFSISVPEGQVTWKIEKGGYGNLEGTSSISIMEETKLDGTKTVMKRTDDKGSPFILIMIIILVIVILLGFVIGFIIIRKKKDMVDNDIIDQEPNLDPNQENNIDTNLDGQDPFDPTNI